MTHKAFDGLEVKMENWFKHESNMDNATVKEAYARGFYRAYHVWRAKTELMRREDQERFIKRVPSYVPHDKGVWIHTGNGMWEKVKDKFCDNGLKYEVVMFDNIEESEKLKERSHKIAEMMMIKEYKMFKRYVLLEFYAYLKSQDDECALEEVKVELENEIKDSNKDTMLHKWRKARAEVFLLLIDKIRQTYTRLTDKSLAVELAEIVKNLKDIEL